MTRVPVRRVRWAKAHRVVSSRYPPIEVFERVADPADWDALYAVEALTNPRVREAWGEIALVPVSERVSGPGAGFLMAAFTHVGRPSRFSDGSYGVYYAARALETAIHETAFHFGRFLAATDEPMGTELELRVLVSTGVDRSFHDLRGGFPELHDPDDYGPPQRVGRELRDRGSHGLVYDSVRHRGGHCLAVFRPKAIPPPVQGPHLRYHFDGQRIDRWFRIGGDDWKHL
ncbi:MAG: RES family NAD+ phosphorylase [Myxococcota bacterium]